MFYISAEDLIANALIESMNLNKCRFLSYQEIDLYSSAVVQQMKLANQKAVCLLFRDNINPMLKYYSNFFEEKTIHEHLGIEVKENISIEELITKFRGHLHLDVLLALIHENSVSCLRKETNTLADGCLNIINQ